MASINKRQITIERHSITKIRISGKSRFVFCEVCQSQTLVFTPAQVANFLQMNADEIKRQIETGAFHLVDNRQFALICGNSLESKNENNKKLLKS